MPWKSKYMPGIEPDWNENILIARKSVVFSYWVNLRKNNSYKIARKQRHKSALTIHRNEEIDKGLDNLIESNSKLSLKFSNFSIQSESSKGPILQICLQGKNEKELFWRGLRLSYFQQTRDFILFWKINAHKIFQHLVHKSIYFYEDNLICRLKILLKFRNLKKNPYAHAIMFIIWVIYGHFNTCLCTFRLFGQLGIVLFEIFDQRFYQVNWKFFRA